MTSRQHRSHHHALLHQHSRKVKTSKNVEEPERSPEERSPEETGTIGKEPSKLIRSKMKAELNQGMLSDLIRFQNVIYEHLEQKDYDVFDFYHETGVWQAIAKSEKFSSLVLTVISANAIWIGVDADHNTKPSGQTEIQFVIADHTFCAFFVCELLIRFSAFAKKVNCLKDRWFLFDSILVMCMVLETWIMPALFGVSTIGGTSDVVLFRLLRLFRLTRLARLMRHAPELVRLVKGMVVATRSVSSVLVLLIILTYIFAVIFKQQTQGDEELEVLFGTIPEAMWNLLMAGTLCDSITTVLNQLREHNGVMCALFLLWVVLSSFTVLNMLIGVICEVVSGVSAAEQEKTAVSFAKSQFLTVLEEIDRFGTGSITEEDFETFVMHDSVQAPLEALQVDRESLLELSDIIFAKKKLQQHHHTIKESTLDKSLSQFKSLLKSQKAKDHRELRFGELLEKILDLRSSNPATVSHLVDLRKYMRSKFGKEKHILQRMEVNHEGIEDVKQMLKQVLDGQKALSARMERIEEIQTRIPGASLEYPSVISIM